MYLSYILSGDDVIWPFSLRKTHNKKSVITNLIPSLIIIVLEKFICKSEVNPSKDIIILYINRHRSNFNKVLSFTPPHFTNLRL